MIKKKKLTLLSLKPSQNSKKNEKKQVLFFVIKFQKYSRCYCESKKKSQFNYFYLFKNEKHSKNIQQVRKSFETNKNEKILTF